MSYLKKEFQRCRLNSVTKVERENVELRSELSKLEARLAKGPLKKPKKRPEIPKQKNDSVSNSNLSKPSFERYSQKSPVLEREISLISDHELNKQIAQRVEQHNDLEWRQLTESNGLKNRPVPSRKNSKKEHTQKINVKQSRLEIITKFKDKLLSVIDTSALDQSQKWKEATDQRVSVLEEESSQLLKKFSQLSEVWRICLRKATVNSNLLLKMNQNNDLLKQVKLKGRALKELEYEWVAIRKAFLARDKHTKNWLNDFEMCYELMNSTRNELDRRRILAKVEFEKRLIQELHSVIEMSQKNKSMYPNSSDAAGDSRIVKEFHPEVRLSASAGKLEIQRCLSHRGQRERPVILDLNFKKQHTLTPKAEYQNNIESPPKGFRRWSDVCHQSSICHSVEAEVEQIICIKIGEALKKSLKRADKQLKILKNAKIKLEEGGIVSTQTSRKRSMIVDLRTKEEKGERKQRNSRYKSKLKKTRELIPLNLEVEQETLSQPNQKESGIKKLVEHIKPNSEQAEDLFHRNDVTKDQINVMKKKINLQVKQLSIKEEEIQHHLDLIYKLSTKWLERTRKGVLENLSKSNEKHWRESGKASSFFLSFPNWIEGRKIIKESQNFHIGEYVAKCKSAIVHLRKELSELSSDLKYTIMQASENCKKDLRVLCDSFSNNSLRRKLNISRTKLANEISVRRKLMCEVQKIKGNIRVLCRVRPLLEEEKKRGMQFSVDFRSHDSVTVFSDDVCNDGMGLKSHTFCFDRCFDAHQDQKDVFKELEVGLLTVLEGFHICIFAYGMTGSGKTYTIEGPRTNPGILGRSVEMLFNYLVEHSEEFDWTVHVSLLEIYNDELHDLLLDGEEKKLPLKIITQKSSTTIANLTKTQVSSIDETLKVLYRGAEARVVGPTNSNVHSSRSHMVATVYISKLSRYTQTTTKGRLNLIDLAGNERLKDNDVEGKALAETLHINRSLTALGDVMTALERQSVHVPYRNSKLTQLLQSSLENSFIYMFVNISPASIHARETYQTLQFAKRARKIQIGPLMSHQLSKTFSTNSRNLQHQKKIVGHLEEQLVAAGNENKTLSEDLVSAKKHAEKEITIAKKRTKALNDLVRVQSDAYLTQAKAAEKNVTLTRDNASLKNLHDTLEKKFALKADEADMANSRLKSVEMRLTDHQHQTRLTYRKLQLRQHHSTEELNRVKLLLQQERNLRSQASNKAQIIIRSLEKQVTCLKQDKASLRLRIQQANREHSALPILLSPARLSKRGSRSVKKRKPRTADKRPVKDRKREVPTRATTAPGSTVVDSPKIVARIPRVDESPPHLYNDEAWKSDESIQLLKQAIQKTPKTSKRQSQNMDSIHELKRQRRGKNPFSARSTPGKLLTQQKFTTPRRTSASEKSTGSIRLSSRKSSAVSRKNFESSSGNKSLKSQSSGVKHSPYLVRRRRKSRGCDAIRRHVERTRKAKQRVRRHKS